MSLAFRELERFDHRVLGALRLVDGATGAPIDQQMLVNAPGARILRNKSGLYVIREWTTLAAHAAEFSAPPATPLVGSQPIVVAINDPGGRYLPRSVVIGLPRDPLPANAANVASLFRAVDVPMFPSSVAPVSGNWAVVRVTLTATPGGDALGGALIRVMSNGNVIARGLTDWRGEALVPVVGIPITTWSTEPDVVVVSEISATIQAAFDAASGTRVTAAQLATGNAPGTTPSVNPTTLEANFAGLPQTGTNVMLAAGRPLHVSLQIALS